MVKDTQHLPTITEVRRLAAPAPTPQALAWHDGALWVSSRDRQSVAVMEVDEWKVREEFLTPGIPWAAVSDGEGLWFTLGVGAEDDRYLRRYVPGKGFSDDAPIACPDLTGSYLSFDGANLFLSQWYCRRILRLARDGKVEADYEIGEEICGHTMVDGVFYLLRGTEEAGESWCVARFDPRERLPEIKDLARVPFACRSLAFDGERFWTSHRAADEVVAFTLPEGGPAGS